MDVLAKSVACAHCFYLNVFFFQRQSDGEMDSLGHSVEFSLYSQRCVYFHVQNVVVCGAS